MIIHIFICESLPVRGPAARHDRAAQRVVQHALHRARTHAHTCKACTARRHEHTRTSALKKETFKELSLAFRNVLFCLSSAETFFYRRSRQGEYKPARK